MKEWKKYVIPVCLAVALFFCIVGFIWIANRKKYRKMADGVVSLDKDCKRDGKKFSCDFSVSYKVDGKDIVIRKSTKNTQAYNDEDKYKIFYDPKNPKDAVLKYVWYHQIRGWIMIFLAVCLFWIAAYLYKNSD